MAFEEWWEQVEAYGLGLPEGYVLVPVEPTEKMLNDVSDKSVAEYIYQAMIKAAQDEE